MPHEFVRESRVEFADTDMAGIVHFAQFFRWMEETEHAFFRSLGIQLHRGTTHERVGFARVHADCDYRRPLTYPERFAVRLAVRRIGKSSLSYDFSFHGPLSEGQDPLAGEPVARGALSVACVTRDTPEGPLRSADVPSVITERLEVAPPEDPS